MVTVHVAAVAFFTGNDMLLVAALWACQAVILVHVIVDNYRLHVYPREYINELSRLPDLW